MSSKYNLKVGEVYGIYEVIDSTIYQVKNKTNNIHRGHIKVKCILCGKEQLKRGDAIKSCKSNKCRTCSNREKYRENIIKGRIHSTGYSPKHKGVGNLPKSLYWHYKKRAENRGHEFSITIEYLWELFEKQKGRCVLSGIIIKLFEPGEAVSKKTKCGSNINFDIFDASLDRIDSTKGYVEGNVQWVHRHINIMKNVYTQEYFIDMCTKVTLTQKKEKI